MTTILEAPITLEPLLSIEDVSEVTRTPKSTLYSLRTGGRGPLGFKVGRALRYRQSDVVAWLDNLASEAAASAELKAAA